MVLLNLQVLNLLSELIGQTAAGVNSVSCGTDEKRQIE